MNSKIFTTSLLFFGLVTNASIVRSEPLKDFKPNSDPAIVGISGLFGTASPNLKALPKEIQDSHRLIFKLQDGTQISTLYFKVNPHASNPLILANFGLTSDSSSPQISLFVNSLVLNHKLNSDVLIVSSVTSPSFYSLNHELGLGGFDEGRILVEVKDQLEVLEGVQRPATLFGVSLGGAAVIQALLEDQRELGKRFLGAITFSAVLNELESERSILQLLGSSLRLSTDQSNDAAAKVSVSGRLILKTIVGQSAHKFAQAAGLSKIHTQDFGAFFDDAFRARLARLKSRAPLSHWNSSVSLASAEDYAVTSSSLHSQIDQIKVPLIVVHAKNDPLVPYSQFKTFEQQELNSKNILTYGIHFGGHWGFLDTYGADWMNQLIQELQNKISSQIK